MKKINEIIEVEEIFDIIETGVTIPVICRLKNGIYAVVKYRNNPFSSQVLINELIGYQIADLIGITVPEYGICNLSREVIKNTNKNEEINEENAGIAFFSQYYPRTVPLNRPLLSLTKNKETEKIILFDYIVNNHDRHEGNLLIDLEKNFTIYMIDNSHIITERLPSTLDSIEGEMSLKKAKSSEILIDNKAVYEALCLGGSYKEKTMVAEAENIKKVLGKNAMDMIRKSIPDIWISFFGNDKIEKILAAIDARVEHINEICEYIIQERRKL